ncbi:MAG: hypothetical protein AB1724_17950 [Thermodesulfobacteriota bacterium]
MNEKRGKPSRPRGNWQLLLINEYGRTVRINHPRRYLFVLGGTVLLLLIMALGLAGLFFHERATRQELQTSLTHVQDTVSSLMNENDALTARLAGVCENGQAPVAPASGTTPTATP